jgi:hypothetical protein
MRSVSSSITNHPQQFLFSQLTLSSSHTHLSLSFIMSRFFALLVAALVALKVNAFTGELSLMDFTHSIHSILIGILQSCYLSLCFSVSPRTATPPFVALQMSTEEDNEMPRRIPTIERGVSVDQDGKSNVWAIEPKVEVDNRSSEEKTTSALVGGGAFAAIAAAAGAVIANLPDPNQF